MQNKRIEKLLELQKDEPSDIFIIYALGMEYESMGNTTEAVEQFKLTLEQDIKHVPAYYQLGLLYLKSNNEEAAITYLTKGMELAKEKKDQRSTNEFKALLDELAN